MVYFKLHIYNLLSLIIHAVSEVWHLWFSGVQSVDLAFKTEDVTWNIYIVLDHTYHWLSFDQIRFNPGLSQAASRRIITEMGTTIR